MYTHACIYLYDGVHLIPTFQRTFGFCFRFASAPLPFCFRYAGKVDVTFRIAPKFFGKLFWKAYVRLPLRFAIWPWSPKLVFQKNLLPLRFRFQTTCACLWTLHFLLLLGPPLVVSPSPGAEATYNRSQPMDHFPKKICASVLLPLCFRFASVMRVKLLVSTAPKNDHVLCKAKL